MDLTNLTVHEVLDKIDKKEIKALDVTKAYSENIEKRDKDLKAFITPLNKEALKEGEELQKKIDSGEVKGKFLGIPIRNKR